MDKIKRRTHSMDPPGSLRSSSSSLSPSFPMNPLREIHNHRHKHQHELQRRQQQHQQQYQKSHRKRSKVNCSPPPLPVPSIRKELQHKSNSSSSTFPSHQKQRLHLADKAGPPIRRERSQRRRRVHFVSRAKNQRYENSFTIQPKDYALLWYSAADLRNFHCQTKQQALHVVHPHYTVWTQNLHRVYHAFLALQDAHEIWAILQETPTTCIFHPAGLGMERRAVSLVAEDTASRKRQLYAAVARCQAAPVPDAWLRAQMLREMCRTVSKPSRLYARHVAHMTAVADDQDDKWE